MSLTLWFSFHSLSQHGMFHRGCLWVSEGLRPPSLTAEGWVLVWGSLVGPGKCSQRSRKVQGIGGEQEPPKTRQGQMC